MCVYILNLQYTYIYIYIHTGIIIEIYLIEFTDKQGGGGGVDSLQSIFDEFPINFCDTLNLFTERKLNGRKQHPICFHCDCTKTKADLYTVMHYYYIVYDLDISV